MERDFWLARWEENNLGWHQPNVNQHLVRHWHSLPTGAGRVLVPLCGKSLDMHWLAGQDRAVLGVELSERAIVDFFAEAELTPEVAEEGDFTAYRHGDFTLLQGDFFALTASHLEGVTATFDRAAIIALPPQMRQRYAAHLLSTLAPGTCMLLVGLEYDQSVVPGPPHAVLPEELAELFGESRLRELGSATVQALPPKFREAGIEQATERAYQITI